MTRLVKLQALGCALLCVGAVTVGASAFADGSYKGYEQPPFSVVSADGDFQIRDYGPHLLAQVKVRGPQAGGINRGFQVLAGYIFGGNADDQSIKMTVPVAQTVEGDISTVSFMMPSKFDLETLPDADANSIRFVENQGGRQAVLGFSGIARSAQLQERTAALRAWADANGMTITGAPIYYFYDDPFTLPWNRRNEVAFAVE